MARSREALRDQQRRTRRALQDPDSAPAADKQQATMHRLAMPRVARVLTMPLEAELSRAGLTVGSASGKTADSAVIAARLGIGGVTSFEDRLRLQIAGLEGPRGRRRREAVGPRAPVAPAVFGGGATTLHDAGHPASQGKVTFGDSGAHARPERADVASSGGTWRRRRIRESCGPSRRVAMQRALERIQRVLEDPGARRVLEERVQSGQPRPKSRAHAQQRKEQAYRQMLATGAAPLSRQETARKAAAMGDHAMEVRNRMREVRAAEQARAEREFADKAAAHEAALAERKAQAARDERRQRWRQFLLLGASAQRLQGALEFGRLAVSEQRALQSAVGVITLAWRRCAERLRMRMRRRKDQRQLNQAANLIVRFARDHSGLAVGMNVVMRKYRRKVIHVQRMWRSFSLVTEARIQMLRSVWEELVEEEHSALLRLCANQLAADKRVGRQSELATVVREHAGRVSRLLRMRKTGRWRRVMALTKVATRMRFLPAKMQAAALEAAAAAKRSKEARYRGGAGTNVEGDDDYDDEGPGGEEDEDEDEDEEELIARSRARRSAQHLVPVARPPVEGLRRGETTQQMAARIHAVRRERVRRLSATPIGSAATARTRGGAAGGGSFPFSQPQQHGGARFGRVEDEDGLTLPLVSAGSGRAAAAAALLRGAVGASASARGWEQSASQRLAARPATAGPKPTGPVAPSGPPAYARPLGIPSPRLRRGLFSPASGSVRPGTSELRFREPTAQPAQESMDVTDGRNRLAASSLAASQADSAMTSDVSAIESGSQSTDSDASGWNGRRRERRHRPPPPPVSPPRRARPKAPQRSLALGPPHQAMDSRSASGAVKPRTGSAGRSSDRQSLQSAPVEGRAASELPPGPTAPMSPQQALQQARQRGAMAARRRRQAERRPSSARRRIRPSRSRSQLAEERRVSVTRRASAARLAAATGPSHGLLLGEPAGGEPAGGDGADTSNERSGASSSRANAAPSTRLPVGSELGGPAASTVTTVATRLASHAGELRPPPLLVGGRGSHRKEPGSAGSPALVPQAPPERFQWAMLDPADGGSGRSSDAAARTSQLGTQQRLQPGVKRGSVGRRRPSTAKSRGTGLLEGMSPASRSTSHRRASGVLGPAKPMSSFVSRIVAGNGAATPRLVEDEVVEVVDKDGTRRVEARKSTLALVSKYLGTAVDPEASFGAHERRHSAVVPRVLLRRHGALSDGDGDDAAQADGAAAGKGKRGAGLGGPARGRRQRRRSMFAGAPPEDAAAEAAAGQAATDASRPGHRARRASALSRRLSKVQARVVSRSGRLSVHSSARSSSQSRQPSTAAPGKSESKASQALFLAMDAPAERVMEAAKLLHALDTSRDGNSSTSGIISPKMAADLAGPASAMPFSTSNARAFALSPRDGGAQWTQAAPLLSLPAPRQQPPMRPASPDAGFSSRNLPRGRAHRPFGGGVAGGAGRPAPSPHGQARVARFDRPAPPPPRRLEIDEDPTEAPSRLQPTAPPPSAEAVAAASALSGALSHQDLFGMLSAVASAHPLLSRTQASDAAAGKLGASAEDAVALAVAPRERIRRLSAGAGHSSASLAEELARDEAGAAARVRAEKKVRSAKRRLQQERDAVLAKRHHSRNGPEPWSAPRLRRPSFQARLATTSRPASAIRPSSQLSAGRSVSPVRGGKQRPHSSGGRHVRLRAAGSRHATSDSDDDARAGPSEDGDTSGGSGSDGDDGDSEQADSEDGIALALARSNTAAVAGVLADLHNTREGAGHGPGAAHQPPEPGQPAGGSFLTLALTPRQDRGAGPSDHEQPPAIQVDMSEAAEVRAKITAHLVRDWRLRALPKATRAALQAMDKAKTMTAKLRWSEDEVLPAFVPLMVQRLRLGKRTGGGSAALLSAKEEPLNHRWRVSETSLPLEYRPVRPTAALSNALLHAHVMYQRWEHKLAVLPSWRAAERLRQRDLLTFSADDIVAAIKKGPEALARFTAGRYLQAIHSTGRPPPLLLGLRKRAELKNSLRPYVQQAMEMTQLNRFIEVLEQRQQARSKRTSIVQAAAQLRGAVAQAAEDTDTD